MTRGLLTSPHYLQSAIGVVINAENNLNSAFSPIIFFYFPNSYGQQKEKNRAQ